MSLAALEVIVHYSAIPADYIGIEIIIPDAVAIATADDLALPEGWPEIVPEEITAARGTAWVRSGRTAALRVPSAVIPSEYNIILNPAHPDFALVEFRFAEEIHIDRRLLSEHIPQQHE